MMTPLQQAVVDEIRAAVEDDETTGGTGPARIFEGSAGDDDVLVLFDSDTRIIRIYADGVADSGYVMPRLSANTLGWDDGWTP